MFSNDWDEQISVHSKEYMLNILFFLVDHIEKHEKRAYLAVYLESIQVPDEYLQQDGAL